MRRGGGNSAAIRKAGQYGVKAQDILADHMQVGGPETPVIRGFLVGIPRRRDIIGERVEPNVHDVVVVARHRHSPFEGCAGNRKSSSPPFTKLTTSFRRDRGRIKRGLAS